MRNRVKSKLLQVIAAFCALLAGPNLTAEGTNAILARHLNDLVVVQGSGFASFKPDAWLKARYIVIYFGAGWCPDCRHFSPSLVAAYDHQPADRERFEVLLLPMDRTEAEQLKFMRAEKMSWPALGFDKMASATDLRKYHSGKGIPWLSIIDSEGQVVLQSKNDQDAAQVLRGLEDLVKRKN